MYLMLILMLAGCAHAPTFTTPPEFAPYVSAFKSAYGRDFDSVAFAYATLPEGIVGRCSVYADHGLVEVDHESWDGMDASEKEEIIFHELGHCVLHRDHLNTLNSSFNPVSIMNAYELEDTYYVDNRKALVVELFTGNGPMLKLAVDLGPKTFECE